MAQIQATCTRKAPQFKSRLTELRSLTHSLSADLGYCEGARRGILLSLAGNRYARDLTEEQLETVVAWMRARLEEKAARRPYTEAELDTIHYASSVDELLA